MSLTQRNLVQKVANYWRENGHRHETCIIQRNALKEISQYPDDIWNQGIILFVNIWNDNSTDRKSCDKYVYNFEG